MRFAAVVSLLLLAAVAGAAAHGSSHRGSGGRRHVLADAHAHNTVLSAMLTKTSASAGPAAAHDATTTTPVQSRVKSFHTMSLAGAQVHTAGAPYPPRLNFELALGARRYRVSAEQNMALTAPDYTEQVSNADGSVTTLRRGSLTRDDNCYYQGHAQRLDAASATPATPYVALDVCNGRGVRGSLFLDGRWYSIEPAAQATGPATAATAEATAAADAVPHVVYANDDMFDDSAKLHEFCGSHSHAHDAHRTSHHTGLMSSSSWQAGAFASVPEEYANVDLRTLHKTAAAQRLADERAAREASPAPTVQGVVLPNTTSTSLRYVELFIVNDYQRYSQMVDATESDALAIANRASVLYAQNSALTPPVNIVLVGQLTWRTADPYASQVCMGPCSSTATPCTVCGSEEIGVTQLLGLWNTWRSSPANTQGLPYHDAGFLLSGYNFEGSLVGFAGIGVMCDYTQSGGIVQTYTYSTQVAGFTLTHELGHTLGMVHDGNGYSSCSPRGSIMTTQVDLDSLPEFFSPCSLNSWQYYFGNLSILTTAAYPDVARPMCLDNRPDKQYVMLRTQAACGNGFIEVGETCDCGARDCMTLVGGQPADRCCNGTSCQLLPNKLCSANSACCDPTTCQPLPAPTSTGSGTTCRYADPRSGCDASQMCDGANATCPSKAFQPAGTSCVNPRFNAAGFCDALDSCSNLAGHVTRRHGDPLFTTVMAVAVAVVLGVAGAAVAARRHA